MTAYFLRLFGAVDSAIIPLSLNRRMGMPAAHVAGLPMLGDAASSPRLYRRQTQDHDLQTGGMTCLIGFS